MEQRVSKLEVDVKISQLQIDEMKEHHKNEINEIKKSHKKEIEEIKVVIEVLQNGVNDITKLISSIKWWVIGAVSILAIKELGLGALFFKLVALL